MVVALDRVGIGGNKEPDAQAEGRWRVDVAREDLARALAALRDEQLPRRDLPSVLEAVGKGSLVPSESTERAQLLAGVAGDLERSLEGVEGVLSARVHLSVPAPTPFRTDTVLVRGSGSVLVEHRGVTPPLSAEAVARLVSGAVAGLMPSDIAVVMLSRPTPADSAMSGAALAHVGPIAVAPASLRKLQAALLVLVAAVAALAAATVFLASRLARVRAALAREPGEPS